MLNILIISDEAKDIYALFKSAGFAPDMQDSQAEPAAAESGSSTDESYDIAFLDLDTENWEQRILDVRHRMPVIAFARPEIRKAVEAMKLGASDFLEKPLTAAALSGILDKNKKEKCNKK